MRKNIYQPYDRLETQSERIEHNKRNIEFINNEISDYYTKAEVDEKIDNVKVDLSDYYTKAEVDEKVDNVKVDLSDYYTKDEVNGGFKRFRAYKTGEFLSDLKKGLIFNGYENFDYTGVNVVNFIVADYYLEDENNKKWYFTSSQLTCLYEQQWNKRTTHRTLLVDSEGVSKVAIFDVYKNDNQNIIFEFTTSFTFVSRFGLKAYG